MCHCFQQSAAYTAFLTFPEDGSAKKVSLSLRFPMTDAQELQEKLDVQQRDKKRAIAKINRVRSLLVLLQCSLMGSELANPESCKALASSYTIPPSPVGVAARDATILQAAGCTVIVISLSLCQTPSSMREQVLPTQQQ